MAQLPNTVIITYFKKCRKIHLFWEETCVSIKNSGSKQVRTKQIGMGGRGIFHTSPDEKKGEISLTEFSSLEVRVYDNNLEKAMRVLKKKLQDDGLFRRLKAKRSYEKPSECRRRKRRESERRQRTARLKSSRNYSY